MQKQQQTLEERIQKLTKLQAECAQAIEAATRSIQDELRDGHASDTVLTALAELKLVRDRLNHTID